MDTAAIILMVEDEPFIAIGLQNALTDGGYDVRVEDSGTDASNVIARGEIVLAGLITDIRLGDGPDGWEVARLARERHPALPVVYMSGDSAHEHSSRGVPNSIMVSKPFAPAQIITAISTLLNQIVPTAPEQS